MKLLTTAATLAAFLVSAGTAMAVPVSGVPANSPVPSTAHYGQSASNQNIRAARRHIERAVDRLQNDAWDYGGHKEKAIDDLGVARQFLEQGLAWERSHHGTSTSAASGAAVAPAMGGVIPIDNHQGGPGMGNGRIGGQQGSNENIAFVRQHIQAAISVLQSDSSDYGGYKERAIDRLQAADGEMQAALGFVQRPGVQNGGKNPQVSDANLSYVKEHVMTAIARLQDDAHDYGGHRAAAVSDLSQANSDLASALAYDNSHDRYNSTAAGGAMPMGGPMGTTTLGQQRSNDSLSDARTQLETAIDALQRDGHDYNGYRVKAMASMQAARSQIEQALQYRSQHGLS